MSATEPSTCCSFPWLLHILATAKLDVSDRSSWNDFACWYTRYAIYTHSIYSSIYYQTTHCILSTTVHTESIVDGVWQGSQESEHFQVTGTTWSGVEHQGPVSWRPTTVKWWQFSQSNSHSTIGNRQTEYYEALPSSANDEVRCDCTFADDGNASWYSACRVPMVDCEYCCHLTVVCLHDTGARPVTLEADTLLTDYRGDQSDNSHWQSIKFVGRSFPVIRLNIMFVGWLLNVPATGSCISGTDLLRQFYVLPHWDRSCRSNFPSSHSILTPGRPIPALTLKRQAPGRVATGVPMFKSQVWLSPEKILAQAGFDPGTFRSRGGRLTTRPTRRCRLNIAGSIAPLLYMSAWTAGQSTSGTSVATCTTCEPLSLNFLSKLRWFAFWKQLSRKGIEGQLPWNTLFWRTRQASGIVITEI